jgi:hypothetical protein
MKPTKYFSTKSALTDFAKTFAKSHPQNWFLRTTLECAHKVNERRKSIILISDEKIVQRLTICGTCKNANVEPQNKTV